MNIKKKFLYSVITIMVILGLSLSNIKLTILSAQDAYAAPSVRTDAIVLVNSTSPHYADFQNYIQPYLDNFGIPYTVLDISTTPVTSNIGDYAVIIIGHRSLDVNNQYLNSTEQSYITNAVSAGTGLVNFDNDLASAGVGYYQYVQSIFSFSFTTPTTGSGVKFGPPEQQGYQINLYDPAHQDPVLPLTTNPADLDPTRWTEFLWAPRGYPGIFGGYNEPLPLLHFFGAIPNGQYDLVAHLFWEKNITYSWGYTSDNPNAYSFDVYNGNQGDFSDYTIGTVQITNGQFDLYVQDAASLPGGINYPYFGWSWVRLVPTTTPPPQHYITAYHQPNEEILTNSMVMAGISTPIPANDTALAYTDSQPFLTVTNYGQGRAVQWGTYDWMSYLSKGPVYGLDDLAWRSIVWASRKPFVMQGMPPFVTMRVDNVSGPVDWANTATALGFKPWMGLFYHNIDTSNAAAISALVNAGKATAGVKAKTDSDFFYYNHLTGNLSDGVIAANYADATAFFTSNNIPISKYVVPHFYEIGTNAFQGLSNWGVAFVGTVMTPGNPYHSDWLHAGPFDHDVAGSSSDTLPVYYADYLTIPGHPEFNNQFIDCITEIRDDAGYEWYPDQDVQRTIGRGTRQTERAFNSMVLAALFTNEGELQSISPSNWQAILTGIKTNLEPYGPIYVTMDYACQYVRAIHNSNITPGSSYDIGLNILTTSLSGSTDMPTKFYVFTQNGANIRQIMVDVPAFNGSTTVNFTIPGPLDHIAITPASATVPQGGQQAFSAMGYDASNNPIPNLAIRWNVVNGGGTINMDGVFTANGQPGNYPNTIQASYNGLNAYASIYIGIAKNVGIVTGWNMVSVPVQADNMQLSVLFPGITPPAYYFTTAYQPVQGSDTLVTGRGYWMYFNTAHTYTISGQPVSPQDIPVNAGWNMIGPFDHSVLVSAITSTPAGILLPPLYGYSNGYSQATTLQPGVGYWAYATQAGTLHLGSGGNLAAKLPQALPGGLGLPQDFRLPIEVSNGGGMMTVVLGVSPQGTAGYDVGLDQLAPPPAPAGAFDVRLANEGVQYLEDVRSSQPGEYTFTLLLSPEQEGENIVLKWDAEALAGLGKFEIRDLISGELYALDMSTIGELVIQPGSVLYSGLQIQVKTDQPRYPLFLPLLVH